MKHLLTLLILTLPTIVFGQDTGFVPLVGIPYVNTQAESTTLGDYVNGLYWASISIAAVLAFLKITWAGIKYMMSEIVTDKQSAKSDIKGALLGLIIILAAVLILDTINPSIKNLTALNLVPLTGDVGVPQTECQKDPASVLCCTDRGGTYILTSTGSICDGEDSGIGLTGDPVQDKLTCEVAGDIWDIPTSKCKKNNPALFNYNDVAVVDGVYSIPTAFHDKLDTAKLLETLEIKCTNAGGNGSVDISQVGTNTQYACGGIESASDAETGTSLRNTISFNGEEINPTDIYTINEPAISEYDLEAGEFHGQKGTIIGVTEGGSIVIEGMDESEANSDPMVVIKLESGRTFELGCKLLKPTVPGCS
jgi:hypothetical protein